MDQKEIEKFIDRLVQCSKESFDDVAYYTNIIDKEQIYNVSEQYGEYLRGPIETFVYGLREEIKQQGEQDANS